MNEKVETWLPVPGYEGIYSVSDLGNVMSMNFANTGMLKLLTPNKVQRGGYWRVSLLKNKQQKTMYVHAIVMLAFVGPRPVGLRHINHKNAIKSDNRLCNLEYCTALHNKQHASALGLCAHNENNGGAKLTNSDVLAIREKLAAGVKKIALAREYGVSRFAIYRIADGTTWERLN